MRLVVGGGVVIGGGAAIQGVTAGRGGVVSGTDRLVAFETIVGSGNSGSSVGGVVAGAVVVGSSWGSKTTGGRYGSDFRVTVLSNPVGLPALPELHAGTLGVAVGRTGTESLLLLVMAHQEDLDEGAEQEEEGANNRDSEAGGVELADRAEGSRVGDLVTLAVGSKALLGVLRTITKGSLDVARAAGSTITGHDSDGNHGTAAKNIEEYAENGKDCLSYDQHVVLDKAWESSYLSTKAASQQDSEDAVQDDGSRETSDGLLPNRNVGITVGLDCEEVAVDAEYNGGAAELERIQRSRAKLQCSTTETHGCDRDQV